MSGKKKKIYHQKFGQHILTKSKLPIPSRPPPAPRPNASKVSWLVTQSAQNQKQITRKKIKRRQIFRTGVGFFEIRFAKTVIEFNYGPDGHFVLLSSWKNFASRVRYTERGSYSFQKLDLNGLREMGFSCPFRYCIIFSVFTVFQKLLISIQIFLISCLHIFSIEPAKFIFSQIRKYYRECC